MSEKTSQHPWWMALCIGYLWVMSHMACSIIPFKTHFNWHPSHSPGNNRICPERESKLLTKCYSYRSVTIKRKILHKQSLIHQNYLHSLLCFNKRTKRMKVSMQLLSNSFLTVQHTKLRTSPETSARFLSAIILTQTVSYFDSSSKWTISKMLYCYFNPVLLIFFLCLAFFFPLCLLPLCGALFRDEGSNAICI